MNKIDKLNQKICKKIKKEMKKKNITQKNMADKIGTTAPYFCRCLKSLEEGKSILTETIFKIAGALEIEPAELFK